MNSGIIFLVKSLVVAGAFSQAASVDSSFGSFSEPLMLSMCGIALLALGVMKGRKANS